MNDHKTAAPLVQAAYPIRPRISRRLPRATGNGWGKASYTLPYRSAQWLISAVLYADSDLLFTDLPGGKTLVTRRSNGHLVGTF